MKDTSAFKIKLKAHILPLISVLALILMIIDGYRGWTVLLVGAGGVWLFSYFWARALAHGLQIRREIRSGWAQVGDRLEERFTLLNHARFPALWVEVIGQTNMPDYWANQVRAVESKSETRWFIRGLCTRRGLYILGPTTLKTSDPFGIFTVTLHDPASTTLMVMPPILPLPFIQVAPGGRAGDGTPRLRAPELTVNASNVRAYAPGDSMRWIHWPTSARRNEFFVREFEGAPTGDWWIILDLDENVQVGKDQNATDEHGIILAASLADLAMRSGHAVGLVAHSAQNLILHRPALSEAAKGAMLRSLALVEPGNISLAQLLAYAQPQLGQNTSLVVITPAIKGTWLASLLNARRTGAIPTVLLFDPQTFGGTASPEKICSQLASQGIMHQVISRALLDDRLSQIDASADTRWQMAIPLRTHTKPDAHIWQNPR